MIVNKLWLFWQYLTELRRINLGYNLLDSVPTFSITVQNKLQTLVIRNNNLDNLSGTCPPFFCPLINIQYCISIHYRTRLINRVFPLYIYYQTYHIECRFLTYHKLHSFYRGGDTWSPGGDWRLRKLPDWPHLSGGLH